MLCVVTESGLIWSRFRRVLSVLWVIAILGYALCAASRELLGGHHRAGFLCVCAVGGVMTLAVLVGYDVIWCCRRYSFYGRFAGNGVHQTCFKVLWP